MKVLLTIEGGFAKTLFEGGKEVVVDFLEGFQYARKNEPRITRSDRGSHGH